MRVSWTELACLQNRPHFLKLSVTLFSQSVRSACPRNSSHVHANRFYRETESPPQFWLGRGWLPICITVPEQYVRCACRHVPVTPVTGQYTAMERFTADN